MDEENQGKFKRTSPADPGSRFGGVAGAVELSVNRSIQKQLGSFTAPFLVSAIQLGDLAQTRTRDALASILKECVVKNEVLPNGGDEEEGSPDRKLQTDVDALVRSLETEDAEVDANADMAANVLTSFLLRSSPESGLDPREIEHRRNEFGTNAITEKKMDSFLYLCWEAVQDFVLIMLIALGITITIVEVSSHIGECATCWIEGTAILVTVIGVVLITAGIDYGKQFAFRRLTRSLHDTNTKQVIRDAKFVSVTDDDIVVGDILSVNSHNLASIPADCVLLGPLGELHMNESSLTGESKLVRKRPGDVILSGTEASQGSGKMVVIAVGVNSVAGRIKARVYDSSDAAKLEGEDENSPLFQKLDFIAKRIGILGLVAGSTSLFVSCVIGFGKKRNDAEELIEYIITAITVLAVAVPEGLPLAVTLSLAFSSNKMMKDQNLVKHLDACETMGSATTICTDKTGTLTANKMTARALYSGGYNYVVDDPAVSLGDYVKSTCQESEIICQCIAINTMNETAVTETSSSGNPTEVALLHLVQDLGVSYEEIRNNTKGRSDKGALGEFLSQGHQFEFSSARKMMSWAVPLDGGGYRLYCKGASEVVLSRCDTFVVGTQCRKLTDSDAGITQDVASAYARRGMRCLALAYRDLPSGFDLQSKSASIVNSDSSPAYLAELEMNFIALVGIEDPLRKEVPGAIERCYRAGIDVRMVTGDNANTAVSIAYQAGILRDFHFREGTSERVQANLKDNVLLEGIDFRKKVYRVRDDGTKEFDQEAFDRVWPFLRVLARSSPDDKLTLAHGLNQSNLFADVAQCETLARDYGIKVFPDRQVVAMTGDGTNDAPALKRADIGFAMGVAGTQIAKDAADIILLDDNFASIVTAAKWGRNIFASIQKFLQFQLTVNIAAVVTALIGSITYQISPLAAIQLLWVNLLMDSLASLALASEPPVDELLNRPPVNRSDSMITTRMLANMVGQATYQIAVVLTLLFAGPDLFGFVAGHKIPDENSEHYTFIFNTFVMMTLFNEINCRMLKGECMQNNPLFVGILVTTTILQVIIVQFGSIAFKVKEGGLSLRLWGYSVMFGVFALPWQKVINTVFGIFQYCHGKNPGNEQTIPSHLGDKNQEEEDPNEILDA